VNDQLTWVLGYNAYERLASDLARLEALVAEARREYSASRQVPAWCGVDLLKGWAFALARTDHVDGGHGLSDAGSAAYKEWIHVLAALARHPGATERDVPPMPVVHDRRFSSAPRAHRDADFLAAKRARLWEPHVAPVNALVERIIEAGKGDVPFIDPDSGGVDARVLLLLEAPARAAAHGSGMLSADNDDATAAHVWEAYRASGLPREWGVHWNAVPWYVGRQEKIRAVTACEVVEGRTWLEALLDLLPHLRVVLTLGVPARKAVAPLVPQLEARGLAVMSTWHPSPRNYNSRPQAEPAVLAAFAEALRRASHGDAAPSRPDA
jgi:uracil-DNA glycosylase